MNIEARSVDAELLERADGLAALAGALDAVAESGRGRLVLVRGEAGAGKTALVRRFCDGQRARVLRGVCDALFTPSPLGPFLDLGGEVERVAVDGAPPYEVAAALLRELEGPRPTVLVVEDVHWADEASLDVLRIVARRIESVHALVVLTYRDDELDRRHPLRGLLGELSAGALRIAVEPLSTAAVARLAAPHGVDAADLHRRTGGNAFFVTEALASPGEVPETVRDAVLARAARLGPGARELLDAVAVVPRGADLGLLDALAPGPFARLEECLASGMLGEEPGSVHFRNELARLAVEEALPPNVRVALHRGALEALTDGAPDLARLAHHAEGAGDVDAVLRFAPAAAARAAAVGAHREAADQYARALRAAEGLDPAERAELLERRADECYLTDRNPEAVEAQREALVLRRELGDPCAEANALRRLAEFLWCPGGVTESRAAARQAVELLGPLGPSRELGLAYGTLAFLGRAAGDLDASAAWGHHALETAGLLDDAEILVPALATVGETELLAGSAAGLARFDVALRVAEERGLVEWIGRVPLHRGRAHLARRRYDAAERELRRSVAYCSEHGLELFRHYGLAYLARAELDRGRWTEASQLAREVLANRRASTLPTILALVVLGLVRARRGDPEARPLLDEALALGGPTGELPRIGPVAAARAEAAWLDGRTGGVAAETEEALELAAARHWPWVAGELACWRRRAGLREEPPAEIAEPYALELAGEPEAAARAWTRVGCPYEAALALAAADEENALRRSLEQLRRLDAAPAAAVVARRLRELGVRGVPRGPRPATRGNPASLTPRELEVLALVAEGLSNREIAGRFFLSTKTVDHHVGAILRKLQVRTRTQAGAEAMRRGLVAPAE
jgi:DNA-binding CsgD family transcriptional regulator/tetratricopeptide (TPR) repeat protein